MRLDPPRQKASAKAHVRPVGTRPCRGQPTRSKSCPWSLNKFKEGPGGYQPRTTTPQCRPALRKDLAAEPGPEPRAVGRWEHTPSPVHYSCRRICHQSHDGNNICNCSPHTPVRFTSSHRQCKCSEAPISLHYLSGCLRRALRGQFYSFLYNLPTVRYRWFLLSKISVFFQIFSFRD